MSNKINRTIHNSRKTISNIIYGNSNKLIVIVGPCSIHSYKGISKYTTKLQNIVHKYKNLHICVRAYFEKPRTITGWKGLIYDPDINTDYNINKGITKALKILKMITAKKLSIATEFLNTILSNYIKHYITIGTIGARNCESQIHRELASALNIPIGFKNNTYGEITGAINSLIACNKNNNHIYIDAKGAIRRQLNTYNKNCCLILRGGHNITNYKKPHITKTLNILKSNNLKQGLIIDASHDNSKKNPQNQIRNIKCLAAQLQTNPKICGVMIESYIYKGRQNISNHINPYQSITDECLDFKNTKLLLSLLNKAVSNRKHFK
ncbi:3-deoxy-7-phosphoheptulonate synthase [Candidatus Vidania fulgoroideae]|uniref:Phospho-2-dehydro-3-deoxyheptonate aldolase n=1 Tax=Candidatus Vidania fulgoroideorum TaxID=881286 RepID=A0A975ADN1_9PROT|nr:3-deoxy-7-phosphoheptulonate synthase [Candidatus Vidania fulgoroideae]